MALKIALALVVAVLLGGVGLGFYYAAQRAQPQESMQTSSTPTQSVTIGSVTLQVEVESTEAKREQGLSGRTSLADGTGMLFVFDHPSVYGFWMKDMNFAIDMIFADTNGKIITIAHDASPDSYKQNPPKVFYPSMPVLYVLEVPAGFTRSHSIAEGMTLQIN